MLRRGVAILVALASFVSAQDATTTSIDIDIDAISVAIPTTVFNLPVIYVTAENGPTLTATTLASTATASSDPSATAVFDSAEDVSAALSSAVAEATSTAAAKRGAVATCVPQPLGIKYAISPDDAATFAKDVTLPDLASKADTPAGYVQTFAGLTASNSADKYMGYTLMPSYDVATCGAKCNAMTGCNSFNIYFERDPSLNPDSSNCANPSSSINIKCVFWGGAVTTDNANNFGQWRNQFQVLITGSNGYVNATYAAALTSTKTTTAAVADETNDAGSIYTIYTIYYSSDSTRGAYTNAAASASYKDCETACDADSRCKAFTYVGGSNGVGSGTCWLKTELGSTSKSGTNVVSGKKNGSVNKLTILRAFWSDKDVTSKSLSILKVGNSIVINTDRSTLTSQFGDDPWSDNPTSFTVLYSNGTSTGVFVAHNGTGSYTLSASGAGSAPNCEQVAALASDSKLKIASVVYGLAQNNIQSTYDQLLSLARSRYRWYAGNEFFGLDPWVDVIKSWVVFYYNAEGVLSAISGREYGFGQFP